MYTKRAVIYESAYYTVTSYGNGAAYLFTRKPDGATLWIADQGDIVEIESEVDALGWERTLDIYEPLFIKEE